MCTVRCFIKITLNDEDLVAKTTVSSILSCEEKSILTTQYRYSVLLSYNSEQNPQKIRVPPPPKEM